jgi:hypothetical protein
MCLDGVWIGELGLFTTCTQNSEIKVITGLSLISTLYKLLAHAKSFPSLLCLQQLFPRNGF